MELEISDKAIEKIAEIGFDPLFGARPLRRTIQREIENMIAKKFSMVSLKRTIGF